MEYILSQEKLYEVQFDVVLYDQVEEAELDEMWSFVQKKSNQRWLWLAINHDTGDILAYTFEKRKDAVFKEFKKILDPSGITMFYLEYCHRSCY